MEFDLQGAIECADSFYAASDLGCVLTDQAGRAVHCCGQDYTKCRLCALAGKDSASCISTHQYGMQEAQRFGGKYIYFCAMGLTFFTSPILSEQGAQAHMTAGPFLMVDDQDYAAYDLQELSDTKPNQIPLIMEQVKNLPHIDARRVSALSQLLFMSTSFLSNAAQASRLMENGQSIQIQGQISDYLLKIKEETALPYPFREERLFLQALSRGDQELAQEKLNDLLGYILFESGGNMDMIRSRVHELLVLISRTAIDAGGNSAYIDGCLQKYRQLMPQMATVDELSLWLSKTVRSMIDSLFSNRKARHSDLIYHTIQYLQSNFSRKLTLDEIAHSVHISPTYLSRVFKRETGASLVDFLNRIRIEKSRELLADSSLRLIEVALQCGFESQSYFNRMFKLFCDMTPQQYRKLMEEK
ncbi:MAG: helix-turn-helix domain-containing protein [Clostridiales bacterium]|nr:helix-turn-helix domain-containing protein [Clostridiales bacterium]